MTLEKLPGPRRGLYVFTEHRGPGQKRSALVAHGEFMATLCPPSGQNVASILCRHPGPKPVCVATLSFMGLECSFHLGLLRDCINVGKRKRVAQSQPSSPYIILKYQKKFKDFFLRLLQCEGLCIIIRLAMSTVCAVDNLCRPRFQPGPFSSRPITDHHSWVCWQIQI